MGVGKILRQIASATTYKFIGYGDAAGTLKCSVLEVIAAFERASGISIPYEFVGRRDGDLAEYFANAQLAKQTLGWIAQYDLDRMCQDTWRFYQRSRDSVS